MSATTLWHVTSYYRFVPIAREDLSVFQAETKTWMAEKGLLGLVLYAEEGINGTVAGGEAEIAQFKGFVQSQVKVSDVRFKDSVSDVRPFHRITVDIRTEIVGLKRIDLVPETTENFHLTPKEWHQALSSADPKLVIDTRNRYETMAGKFKGAIDPDLKNFSDWGTYLESADLPHDVPIYMYCTGGIRCEKAILEMRSRGFDQVYQLRDGILGYLAECPNELFEGECFVFDERVALDQDLRPTTTVGICPGCGLTSSTRKECKICCSSFFGCASCEENWGPVCSKACRDQWRRHVLKEIV